MKKHIIFIVLLNALMFTSIAQTKPFGSGNFGNWTTDEYGLPAYNFKLGSADSLAHLIGNKMWNGAVYGNGHVEFFSTRYSPKALNNFDVKKNNFSGGFGWIKEGQNSWCTLHKYLPQNAKSETLFGMGYVKKTIENNNLRLTQQIFVPEGDEEIVIEKITFSNLSQKEKEFDYFDYWDVALSSLGAQRKYFKDKVKTFFNSAESTLTAVMEGSQGDFTKPSNIDPAKLTFFVSALNHSIYSYDTKQSAFFGNGSIKVPQQIQNGQLSNSLDSTGVLNNEDAALVTQLHFKIHANSKSTIYLIYGVALKGKENEIIHQYRSSYKSELSKVIANSSTLKISLPKEDEWISREMKWSNYYLMAGMLREEYFKASCLNQGGVYFYQQGKNIALRDPLQHLMPLSYTKPEYAKETLKFALRTMKNNGRLERGTAGFGQVEAFGYDASDQQLYLFWSICDYIFATRDWAFLDEKENYWDGGTATVYDMLKQAYKFVIQYVGKGEHDAIKVKHADWADQFLKSSKNEDETMKRGESTQNQALAAMCYPMLKELAIYKKDTEFIKILDKEISTIVKTLNSTCWKNEFYNRGWVIDTENNVVEVGANYPHLESNSYALLADNLMTANQINSLTSRLSKDNVFLNSGLIVANPNAQPRYGECGGVWLAPAHATIQGLAKYPENPTSKSLAWQEFKKATLGGHANLFPNIYYGIISGPDYWSPESGDVGRWAIPFPQLLMHIHSQALLSSIRFAGIWANMTGYIINPAFPFNTFTWESNRIKVSYSPNRVSGFIKASGNDIVKMTVKLPQTTKNTVVKVNGKNIPFKVENEFAIFQMKLSVNKASNWEIICNI